MKVLKRNGRTEELDVSKIKKYTSEAVAGLANVSLSELEVDAKIQFRDMITTEEIQQTLIKTAVETGHLLRRGYFYTTFITRSRALAVTTTYATICKRAKKQAV